MSIPHTRKGRHAAPARPAGRRLAVTAAALAAGATPLVCGGTAAAAATTGAMTTSSAPQAALYADGAQRTAERLTAALPLGNLVPQLASTSDSALQLAPQVLHDGALGTLSQGVSPQVTDLAGGLIGQTEPLVSQLRRSGVPTVGDVTAKLSSTELPAVGTVGSLTQTLPVTTVLGTQSPVTGALQSLSGL